MSKPNKTGTSKHPPASAQATLADVLKALEADTGLPATRARDLRSAVKRVAALLGETPHQTILNLPQISARLAAVDQVKFGVSAKRLGNIRSDFLAAVKASGLAKITGTAQPALAPAWAGLVGKAVPRRVRIGLSRFAQFASVHGIAPDQVDNATIDRFIGWVTERSLHRNPDSLRRTVVVIWNELSRSSAVPALTVTPAANIIRRIDWQLLPAAFRAEVDDHLRWCAVSDEFDPKSRVRPLSTQSIHLRRNQIHTAVSALHESGVDPVKITSLRDLLSPEALKRILRQRLKAESSRDTAFNRDLAKALVRIAREWACDDPAALSELKRLAAKVPAPTLGLTGKNKRFLRQFDDPLAKMRLFELPARLWKEAKRDRFANFRTLATAQAALAVGILTFIPIRIQNLVALEFDRHLFLREGRGAISTLELESHEVKNRTALAFDIPPHLVRMLVEYRGIAAKIIGHQPRGVFVNVDGTLKTTTGLSDLISRMVKRRTGIVLTPHQFRHLSAKLLLDHSPGNFETVRQLLGQKNLKTTVNFYAGIDSRRAALHHQGVIKAALAARQAVAGRKRPKTDAKVLAKKKGQDGEDQP